MTLQEEKQAVRHKVALQIAQLEAAYLAASDTAIFQQVLALPAVKAAHTIFCYVSVGKEPATGHLIETLLAMGKRVVVPRCQPGGIMDACHLSSLSQLLPAPYGLLEPGLEANVVPQNEVQLVIAPCVAASKQGQRLGHGAGYYDRFLAHTQCPVLCLCRGKLLYDTLPTGPQDIPMTFVVTEEGLYPRAASEKEVPQ